MWGTPFDLSMLSGHGVVIHCPHESSANALMDILAEHGVEWCDGIIPRSGNSCWNIPRENTIYYIDPQKSMTWGDKSALSEYGYTKCTFYGTESPDFSIPSEDEFRSFLGI